MKASTADATSQYNAPKPNAINIIFFHALGRCPLSFFMFYLLCTLALGF
jgi:hypothetical protein